MRFQALAAVSCLLILGGLPTLAAAQGQAPTPNTAKLAAGVSTPTSFADLVQKLLPAVVNIASTQRIKPQAPARGPEAQSPYDQGSDPDESDDGSSPFQEFFQDYMQRRGEQQQMTPTASLGSGFIIDAEKGYIVTNNHVVADSDDVKVTFDDDVTVPATVLGRDDKIDLALLQVKTSKKLTAIKFGDSAHLRVGDWVLAIGNPFGLGGTVTAGIVSAESRDIQAGPYDDFIQTDASINRGNSGGPMFNTEGEVIGINTAIYSPSGGSVGIGFAVPSDLAKPVIEQLLKYGHTRRGWLGVRVQAVTDDIADSLGLGVAKGALVASVTATSPAEKAGLLPGDVILSFDGKEINAMRSLPRTVAETEIARRVPVEYWRGGKGFHTEVTIGELEKAEQSGLIADTDGQQGDSSAPVKTPTELAIPSVGMNVDAISPQDRVSYRIPDDVKGVLVTLVQPMSEAAIKGLGEGDVVVEAGKHTVTDPAQLAASFADAARSGRSLLLLVNRGGDVRYTAVRVKGTTGSATPARPLPPVR